ncbi:hypothetical protein FHS19_003157 [Paenibacillus rhizosphaerae]|uniref:Uncharacterized protein n=1 Tax=Paenibacillus rhizosphaerae TaxID=297318 RepID=A0A839TPR5_9BACL|nr:hypothetical protein [Paenibacillus rhizosphaerae]MBB3128503.1 hypothetical protein [Paenibacillus rhizosphaerae]
MRKKRFVQVGTGGRAEFFCSDHYGLPWMDYANKKQQIAPYVLDSRLD